MGARYEGERAAREGGGERESALMVCGTVKILFVHLPKYNPCPHFLSLQLKYDSNKAKRRAESLLPTTKPAAPHFNVSAMHLNSEVYSKDQHTSHLPLRIIVITFILIYNFHIPIHWHALLALAPFLSRTLAMVSPIDPLLCASDQVNCNELRSTIVSECTAKRLTKSMHYIKKSIKD